MLTFSFKITQKEIPKALEQNFLDKMKEIITLNVKNAVSGLSRRPLDVDVTVGNGILTVKVVDLSVKSNSRNYINDDSITPDDFFNVVSEDSFKNKVIEGAKKSTEEIAKILQSSEDFYRK